MIELKFTVITERVNLKLQVSSLMEMTPISFSCDDCNYLLISRWIERWEEATQKLNFRLLMVALNNKYFGSERLQEHYCHMVKTTLICEQEQIYKLATLNCEFTRKHVYLGILRHYHANNDTNLRIATFNVRMYKNFGYLCKPHSFWVASSHHQRPSRSCCWGRVAFVHGSQPMLINPRSWSEL